MEPRERQAAPAALVLVLAGRNEKATQTPAETPAPLADRQAQLSYTPAAIAIRCSIAGTFLAPQGRDGYMPSRATQARNVRKGCILLCAPPPPVLATLPVARVVLMTES